MKTTFFFAAGLICLFGCQQNDDLGNEVENQVLKIEAEVALNGLSRTSTQADGKVVFQEEDRIGFYMPEDENSGLWTYDGASWNSASSYEWKDKVNDYDFCAYYPYESSVSRTQIPMPDLSQQKGVFVQVGEYDFLTARCTTNYKKGNGVVSFTGENAFKHAYALVSITVMKDKEVENVVLKDLKLEAPGLMTKHTFHFGTTPEEDGTAVSGEEVNTFMLASMDAEVPMEGFKRVIVVNPLTLENPVNLSINYTRDQINYMASTTALGKELKKGCFYNLKLRLKKTGLVVEGNTVEDWNVIPLEDVNVEENPIE